MSDNTMVDQPLTLLDYAEQQFPNHTVDVWADPSPQPGCDVDADLRHASPSTSVLQVVTERAPTDIYERVRREFPRLQMCALTVLPSAPTVFPTADEDRGGAVDVPKRRVAVAVAAGFMAFALITLGLSRVFGLSWAGSGIAAVFGGFMGAMVGLIVGAGRFAGERATTQPVAPGSHIGLIAVLADSDNESAVIARTIGAFVPGLDVQRREIGDHGGWVAPPTA